MHDKDTCRSIDHLSLPVYGVCSYTLGMQHYEPDILNKLHLSINKEQIKATRQLLLSLVF